MFENNGMGISLPTTAPAMGNPMMNNPMMGNPLFGMPSFPQGNNQVVNDQTIKINPQVMALVNPIIELMTQYDMFKKSNPAFGMWDPKNSLNDFEKNRFDVAKKRCVHLIRDIQKYIKFCRKQSKWENKYQCKYDFRDKRRRKKS